MEVKHGEVVHKDATGRYGFIQPDGGLPKIYVNKRDIHRGDFAMGDRVEFHIESNAKDGKQKATQCKPEGAMERKQMAKEDKTDKKAEAKVTRGGGGGGCGRSSAADDKHKGVTILGKIGKSAREVQLPPGSTVPKEVTLELDGDIIYFVYLSGGEEVWEPQASVWTQEGEDAWMEGYSVEQWQDYMDGRAQWAGDDQGEDEQCWLGKDGEERAQQEKWQQNAEAEETEWRQNAKVEESELQQNTEVEEGTWHQKAVTGESQWQQQAEVEEEAWPEQREEDRAWQEPEVCEEEWPEHAVEESTWPEQEASGGTWAGQVAEYQATENEHVDAFVEAEPDAEKGGDAENEDDGDAGAWHDDDDEENYVDDGVGGNTWDEEWDEDNW